MANRNTQKLKSQDEDMKRNIFDNIEVDEKRLRHKASRIVRHSNASKNPQSKHKNKHNQKRNESNLKRRKSKSKSSVDATTNLPSHHNQHLINPENPKNVQKRSQEIKNQMLLTREQMYNTCNQLKEKISQIALPSLRISSIKKYYDEIFQLIDQTQNQSLRELLKTIQILCINPAQHIFGMVVPYQNLLFKRKDIQNKIQEQFERNRKIVTEMSSSDQEKQITKLQELIIHQQQQIDELKLYFVHQRSRSSEKPSFAHQGSLKIISKEKHQKSENKQTQKLKSMKINLNGLKSSEVLGYHDEFMSHLNQMSESWREQAIRQKRF